MPDSPARWCCPATGAHAPHKWNVTPEAAWDCAGVSRFDPHRPRVTFSPNVEPDQVITIAPEEFPDRQPRYVLSSQLTEKQADALHRALRARDAAEEELEAVVTSIRSGSVAS